MKEYKWQSLHPRTKIQFNTEIDPHGWIQWKGTSVCMDAYCSCGFQSHVDAEFAYFFKCPECERVYEINGHVEFIQVKNPEEQDIHAVVTGE